MNVIFDYGRPSSIVLAVLVERDGRELPVQPDVVGLEPPVDAHEHIRLTGPSPLVLNISGARESRRSDNEASDV